MSPPAEMTPPPPSKASRGHGYGSLVDSPRPLKKHKRLDSEEWSFDEVFPGGGELPETPVTTPKRGRSPARSTPVIVLTSSGGNHRIPHQGFWDDDWF